MIALEVRGLRVEHDGRRLLNGVSLEFPAGTLVGLVGPNGAGKTTLLRHVAGLRTPASGAVTLNGRNVLSLGAAERGRAIGYMPQHFEPAWDFTVREVVELGASRAPVTPQRLEAVIAEHELAPLLDRRWSKLSGGERARTLLAAVLVVDPPIVLADEPGAGLDIRHRLDVLRRLRLTSADRILVVVMHDLEIAIRYCDRIVVLAGGQVVLDGPPDRVAASPTLDAVFDVAFQRVLIEGAGGPVLPILHPPAAPPASREP